MKVKLGGEKLRRKGGKARSSKKFLSRTGTKEMSITGAGWGKSTHKKKKKKKRTGEGGK